MTKKLENNIQKKIKKKNNYKEIKTMMDIKVDPQTMKRISAEEASTKYGVLTSKYHDGLRYYLTSE